MISVVYKNANVSLNNSDFFRRQQILHLIETIPVLRNEQSSHMEVGGHKGSLSQRTTNRGRSHGQQSLRSGHWYLRMGEG